MSDLDLTSLGDALETECPSATNLESVDLEGMSKILKDGKVKNVVTMAGAGISTAAGIPDFRSPGSGIYDNLDEYNLPFPLAAFSIDYFHLNPEPFFKVAKRLYRPLAKPTLSHYFIRLLHDKNVLKRHYTQNVDNLDRLAGVPEEKLVEAHGTFHTGHCMDCHKAYSFEFMKDFIMEDKVPTCSSQQCVGVVKPDIVFFGESLPEKFHKCVLKDFKECDLLIIMGTSLTVAPFCSLVYNVHQNVPRLYLNREASDCSFDGEPWDSPENTRDVLVRGDSDDGILRLCELIGWKDELLELKKRTDAALESSQPAEEKKNEGKTSIRKST